MIKSFISVLLLTNYVYSQVSPECNYVATDTDVYPIGACDKSTDMSGDAPSYSSFKFVCEAGYVFKYEYNTNISDEWCHGEPISSTNFTDQVQEFECTLALCDWAEHCSYTGCYNADANYSCNECNANKTLYDKHCVPILTEQCITNSDDTLTYNECIEGVLTTEIFSGANCSDYTSITNTITTGGSDPINNCFDDVFHKVECYSRSIPTCNYAAIISHEFRAYYPINACDTQKDTTDGTTIYSALKYMCDASNDVYKYLYNTSEYCKGTPVSITKINAELSHYECNLNDCHFADYCELTLNECDAAGCDYDTTCHPTITDNCIGFLGGVLIDDTCVNDTLTAGYHQGYDCEPSSLVWNETYSNQDDQLCGADSLTRVQCIDPAETDANSIIYHTTECTQAPTAVTVPPTGSPSMEPTGSPSMEPTAVTEAPTKPPTQLPTGSPSMEPTAMETTMSSEECDVIWKKLIRFRMKFIVNANENKDLIRAACKDAFKDAVMFYDVGDDICVELSDADLMVSVYESDMERRRLQTETETEYEIEMEIKYNNALQNALFGADSFDKNDFKEKFSDFVQVEFREDALVNPGSTVSELQVMDAEKIDSSDGHKVEGALMNAVSILSIVDVLIFIGCIIYVYSIMKKRVIEKGHNSMAFGVFIGVLTWKEYVVVVVEVVATIIRWIFIIDVIIVDKTYLGSIGIVILLLGDIVLIGRYILYKKLCVEQVNDIMDSIKESDSDKIVEEVRQNDMKDEVRYRRVDIAMMGLLLASVEDIPIIIMMLIIGENWDYYAIIVLCFVVSIMSIVMKIILFFKGKYGSVDSDSRQAQVQTKEAIELGKEKKGKKVSDDVTAPLQAETKGDDDVKTDDVNDKATDTKGGDETTTKGGKKEEEFAE